MPASLPKPAESCLTPKQRQAAALLASGKGVRETAAALKCGERTLYTWMQAPDFRALIGEIRDRMLSEAIGKLSETASAAVLRLRALVDDETPTVALRASVSILDALVKLREFGELTTRVTELEEHLAETEDRR